MATLTPEQIADILFQKPERLTAPVASVDTQLTEKPIQGTAHGLASWLGRLTKLFTRSRNNPAPSSTAHGSLDQAISELRTLGMEEETIGLHIGAIGQVVEEQLQASICLAMMQSGKMDAFVAGNITWDTKYHLGVLISQSNASPEMARATSDILEQNAYAFYVGLLNGSKDEMPELLEVARTTVPHPSHEGMIAAPT
ncbi:MAG: hypothetical protein WC043_04765 [Pseudobdellovibrionaceae bacterium]